MIAAILAAAATQTAAVSPWALEDCGLVRRLESGGKPVSLNLFTPPLAGKANFSMNLPALTGDFAYGTGSDGAVTLFPSGERTEAHWHRLTNGDGTSVILEVPRSLLARVKGAAGLRMEISGRTVATLPIDGLSAGLPSLEACNVARLRELGVDPAEELELAAGATAPEPVGKMTDWVGPMDYPREALLRGEQGKVTVIWTVLPEGRVTDCRVLQSSGSQALDRATCDRIASRARYKPSQRPAHALANFRWTLPKGIGAPPIRDLK